MTVADLSPFHLWGLIISGATFAIVLSGLVFFGVAFYDRDNSRTGWLWVAAGTLIGFGIINAFALAPLIPPGH